MGMGVPPGPRPIRRLKERHQVAAISPGTKREGPRVLQKKFPLFRKEEIEPGEVDLLRVDFDLCEVGPVRGIQRKRLSEAVLQIQATVVVLISSVSGVPRRGRCRESHGGKRFDPDVAPLPDTLEPGQSSAQGNPGGSESTGNRRPRALFAQAIDLAGHVEAPLLRLGLRKAECLERHDKFRSPDTIAANHFYIPDTVPILIYFAVVGYLAVASASDWIRPEHECRTVVIEAVDNQADIVVLLESEVLPHVAEGQSIHIRIVGVIAGVEILAVIEEARFGNYTGRKSRVGEDLKEVRRRFGQFPYGLVQEPVNGDCFVDPDGVNDLPFPKSIVFGFGDGFDILGE